LLINPPIPQMLGDLTKLYAEENEAYLRHVLPFWRISFSLAILPAIVAGPLLF
jgi:hypothetical protein